MNCDNVGKRQNTFGFLLKKYHGRSRFSSRTKHPTGTGCRFLQEKGVTLGAAEAKKIKDKIKYCESIICHEAERRLRRLM